MNNQKSNNKGITSAMSTAVSAHKDGKLNNYGPLACSGVGEVKSTCAASWGPAMRR